MLQVGPDLGEAKAPRAARAAAYTHVGVVPWIPLVPRVTMVVVDLPASVAVC
jgi:hypothetical protein